MQRVLGVRVELVLAVEHRGCGYRLSLGKTLLEGEHRVEKLQGVSNIRSECQ